MDILERGMDILAMRAVERVLIVLVGGLAVYLGYRLFIAVPAQRDSGGEIKLPWSISVVFSRVGPGVFFALFGAAIVVASLHYQLRIGQPDAAAGTASAADAGAPSGDIVWMGTAGFENPRDLEIGREMLRRDLRTLAGLSHELQQGAVSLDPGEVNAIRGAIERVAQASLWRVWSKEWGDYVAFVDWAKKLGREPAPDGIAGAVEFYRQTQEVSSP